jgi:hypothetical protein
VTFLVSDQEGKAVANAEVRVGGGGRTPGGPKNKAAGWTDTNGILSCRLQSDGRISYFVRKLGYYDTDCWEYYLQALRNEDREAAFRSGKWQPWNPSIPVLLKQVLNPIPMYAKSLTTGLPAWGVPLGYDLMAGDWVAPHGRGERADLIFTGRVDRQSDDDMEREWIVSFPNAGDGTQEFEAAPVGQGSGLRSPHWAPENGYEPRVTRRSIRRPGQPSYSDRNDNRAYFLRVRTVLDAMGNVKSALYGKIYGDFMQFRYYLNPTPNDRNVEFDPKRNLLKGLKTTEQVTEP